MKVKKSHVLMATVVLLCLSASAVFAAGPYGGGMGLGKAAGGGWGMGTPYQRMYNPSTVETVSGTVESVDQFMPIKGMYYGIHVMLKTDKEVISVHLGPAWFINKQWLTIQKGDTIEVKGSRVTFQGKPALIAAEVKKGGNTLELRNRAGIPVWSRSSVK
jgi:hypothetical protein